MQNYAIICCTCPSRKNLANSLYRSSPSGYSISTAGSCQPTRTGEERQKGQNISRKYPHHRCSWAENLQNVLGQWQRTVPEEEQNQGRGDSKGAPKWQYWGRSCGTHSASTAETPERNAIHQIIHYTANIIANILETSLKSVGKIYPCCKFVHTKRFNNTGVIMLFPLLAPSYGIIFHQNCAWVQT